MMSDEIDFYHLSVKNAKRSCGECGCEATAYVHGVGFRCGSCEDVPSELRVLQSEQRGDQAP